MESKRKINYIIKTFIKPLLKKENYKFCENTWYAQRDECYLKIQFHKSKYNNPSNGFTFGFDFEVIANEKMDLSSKSSIKNSLLEAPKTARIKESSFLPNCGFMHEYHEGGYGNYIVDCCRNNSILDIDANLIGNRVKGDFEKYILPRLGQIQTIDDFKNLEKNLIETNKFFHFYNHAKSLSYQEYGELELIQYIEIVKLDIHEIKANIEMLDKIRNGSLGVLGFENRGNPEFEKKLAKKTKKFIIKTLDKSEEYKKEIDKLFDFYNYAKSIIHQENKQLELTRYIKDNNLNIKISPVINMIFSRFDDYHIEEDYEIYKLKNKIALETKAFIEKMLSKYYLQQTGDCHD